MTRKVTRERISEWEAEFSVGWPEEPENLQYWLNEGITPERTWETFLVRPPGPDMVAILEYYLSRAPLTEATDVMASWRQGTAARAMDVLILHDALSRRADSEATTWLADQLWQLVHLETDEPRDAKREHARLQRELRAARQKRAKALAKVRASFDGLITMMSLDWRDIDVSEYLEVVKGWTRYWREI